MGRDIELKISVTLADAWATTFLKKTTTGANRTTTDFWNTDRERKRVSPICASPVAQKEQMVESTFAMPGVR
jgi:hypothetical protein